MQGINFECFRCARFGGRSQISAVLGRPILPMSTDFLKVLFFHFLCALLTIFSLNDLAIDAIDGNFQSSCFYSNLMSSNYAFDCKIRTCINNKNL